MKHSGTSTTPAFKRLKQGKAFAETSNDIELKIQCWSCLIVSMTFFCNFVLCDKKGTSEKKNCPMMVAISVGFACHALKKQSEIPVPLHH